MTDSASTKYGTHEDYAERADWSHFDDRAFADEWQNEVYELAQYEFKKRDYRTIIDFGCGSGYKLVKYFPPHTTIGVEVEPSLSFLLGRYTKRVWRSGVNVAESILGGDMLLCSDVIEHMPDPAAVLQTFAASACELFVISTPALELMVERDWSPRLGPPQNPSHIREWTTVEFNAFVSRYLKVIDHRITNLSQCTQCVIAVKR